MSNGGDDQALYAKFAREYAENREAAYPPPNHSTQALIAWRCWKVVRLYDAFTVIGYTPHCMGDDYVLRLRSCSQSDVWEPGVAFEAEPQIPEIAPDMPHIGVHAFATREQAEEYASGFPWVIVGSIALWGRVIENRLPNADVPCMYRAQFAYPQHLYVPHEYYNPPAYALDVAADLRRTYGIEAEYV